MPESAVGGPRNLGTLQPRPRPMAPVGYGTDAGIRRQKFAALARRRCWAGWPGSNVLWRELRQARGPAVGAELEQ